MTACSNGRFEVWIEYDRDTVRVAAWDPSVGECPWYPRVLDGEWGDSVPPEICAASVDEFEVRWTDGTSDRRDYDGKLYPVDWSGHQPGETVTIEVRGELATASAVVTIPAARPELPTRTRISDEQTAVEWMAQDTADIACVYANYGSAGAWACTTDVGGVAVVNRQSWPVQLLWAWRAWQVPSAIGVSIWERQNLAVPDDLRE